ncbi:GNAT family N-acetyltransferase [Vibrio ezurae]|uniref:Putative N-acetyltransferase n=1 Tax=Vibrio ezurae NBRC 102218 TaxID=1219080 RepID=U3B6Z2_9VIBR|nr:N-acetyltransferase [Vibrio ezurae]GAD81192.1 putative N-acetyltransferase [Vibrio ezurae NBRC 102218]
MLIRTEAPADNQGILTLLKHAFPTDAEANLVNTLRENGNITLSIVASDDEGRVIGCAQFSPVTLSGNDYGWQGLAPVAVHEDFRNQGVAERMIKEGLDSLLEFGYSACVVLGDPAYYSRFGFAQSEGSNFRCQWDLPEGVFQVLDLTGESFDGLSGLIEYCKEFDQF